MPHLRALCVVPLLLGVLACSDKNPSSDVRGNYALNWDNVLHLKLKIGGAVHETTATSVGQTVTFASATVEGQPVTLDLSAFCERSEVECPSEVLWQKVAIDQPKIEAKVSNSHVINVIDDSVHELPAGQSATVRAGLVDEHDKFALVLGAGGRAAGQEGVGGCALLALSVAGGRFSHTGETVTEPGNSDGGTLEDASTVTEVSWPEGAAVDGIKDGRMTVGYLGGCAFGPILVGATLEISTGFSATRTGDFDPPPYTPLDPETVTPGIVDGGGFDFGSVDTTSTGD